MLCYRPRSHRIIITRKPSARRRNMLTRLLIPFVMSAALVLAGPAHAVEVSGLYDTEVAVVSTELSDRAPAIKRALSRVLVKVTGDAATASRSEVAGLLEEAQSYVQQFKYREVDGARTPFRLAVSFDDSALNGSLNRLSLPVWGRDRPATLAWIAIEEGGKRYLVGSDQRSLARTTLEQVARQRGVPLILPLLDVADQNSIRVADVTGGFGDSIEAASQRYQPEAILVARTSAVADNFWRADWQLSGGGEQITWQTEGENINSVLSRGINGLADRLAQRLATQAVQAAPATQLAAATVATTIEPAVAVAPQNADLVIAVAGVDSLEDYARVDAYLQNLGSIDAHWPYEFDGSSVSFRVELNGESGELERVISLGGTLSRASEIDLDAGVVAASYAGQVLYYRLVR